MEQALGWPEWPTDELGPQSVTILRLAGGVRAVVAVDNTTLGPAIGGVRMRPEVTPAEVVRLARAMTYKNAAVGLPNGGAKAGIAAPPGLSAVQREALIRSFATRIADITDYLPGPDMGTDETAMAWASSWIAAVTTSSTERSCPRCTTSQPAAWRRRRMMWIAASCPSNREAAVTTRILCFAT